MQRRFVLLLIVFSLLTLMTGCRSANKDSSENPSGTPSISDTNNSSTDVESSTYISVQGTTYLALISEDLGAADFAEHCFSTYELLAEELDSSRETSSIFAKNNAGELLLTLSDNERELIRLGLTYSDLTGGAFDITCEPLRQLWDVSTEYFSLPPEDAIAYALSRIDYENVTLNGNTLEFGIEGMMLGTAEIVDGYVMDRLISDMNAYGIQQGTLQIGGLTYYAGTPEGDAHTVSLTVPMGEASQEVATIALSDYAVATANIYDVYYEEDGTLYHPLYNLHTGYPATTDFVSVFVISSSASLAQATAKACYSLSIDEGNAMISNLPDTYAIYLSADGSVTCTDGLTDRFTVTLP